MVMRNKVPRLTLVGAGPGDPDLITRKGWKALQMADVVLYDALIHPELLAEIPGFIPKIYVGKRSGDHSMSQDEINKEIVQAAHRYGHVVRLKGGDSFVFGRGMEEIEHAQKHGISDIEVIPGISSAIAGPASAGIPVTCRGLSQGVWVLTATSKEGKLSASIISAAQSEATVVLLMGIKKLAEISAVFGKYRSPDTPLAVIQNATMENQKNWIGNLGQALAGDLNIDEQAPGIIVIGEVITKAAWKKTILNMQKDGNEIKVQSVNYKRFFFSIAYPTNISIG